MKNSQKNSSFVFLNMHMESQNVTFKTLVTAHLYEKLGLRLSNSQVHVINLLGTDHDGAVLEWVQDLFQYFTLCMLDFSMQVLVNIGLGPA